MTDVLWTLGTVAAVILTDLARTIVTSVWSDEVWPRLRTNGKQKRCRLEQGRVAPARRRRLRERIKLLMLHQDDEAASFARARGKRVDQGG